MRKTTLALALVATASTVPVLAQSVTDLVVMRRAIALPRPRPTPTPTPTPTFAPNTASCDTSKPIKQTRDYTTLISQTTGMKTVAAAVAWCETQKVTKQYSACFYDGTNGANFSEWSGNPVYSTAMTSAWTHYTCTRR